MDGSHGVLSGPFAGRYTIAREIGRGATAIVYLAHDSESDRDVAIKILRRELAESLGADRFLREIRLTQRLHHPNITPVLDSGQHEGQLYFVLPLMEKGTLRQRLNVEKQLPIDVAIDITRTVAEALDYAHREGLVHRDVKPENILFSNGSVCLADFGIARAIERALDESSTTTGIVRGTPAYMSPEQASGEHDYDGRSDIFSLGCVLYEMVAGMPAFMGPTSKSVIAQRFLHPPRELTVYRPKVPAALAAVIERSLEVLPADRFATAAEFASALTTASRDKSVARSRSSRSRRRTILSGAALLVAILAGTFAAWKPRATLFGRGAPAASENTVVLFPIEGDTTLPVREAYDLLEQGFARWKGLNVVDRLAFRRDNDAETAIRNDDEAIEVARSAGAGKYVRARLSRVGQSLRLWSAIFDAGKRTRLYETSVIVPNTLAGADTAVALIADALVLQRSNDLRPGSLVLPAVQLFDAAMAAVVAFNLREADTLLLNALEADPTFSRAALWVAQVRNWNLDPKAKWQTWVERANASGSLRRDEQLLARALLAISEGDYPAACRTYDSLRATNQGNFAAWYGLGQCRNLDDIVVRDRASPSGWRFRGSSHRAAIAYARAFTLAPALHKAYEARAYSKLRDMLYARRSFLRPGRALPPDTTEFLAYATWVADSLVHIPYPSDQIKRGSVRVDPESRATALAKQQQIFNTLAESWAAALPRSPATKEALAISLEIVGDRRAIDTLRLARALAKDSVVRVRLAAEEVFMLVSFARSTTGYATAARALADSLLANVEQVRSLEEAAILSPVAAVVGKCHLSARLASRAVPEFQARMMKLPLSTVAAAESLTVLSALGCRNPADSQEMRSLVDWSKGKRNPDELEYNLFSRAINLTYPLDSARIAHLADVSGDYVFRVQQAATEHNATTVRLVLNQKLLVRSPPDVTPDAAYPEARAWLATGDRNSARRWLDPVLTRSGWVDVMLNDPINTGALLRMIVLRAEIANADRDSRTARQWANTMSALWINADAEINPITQRMRRLALR